MRTRLIALLAACALLLSACAGKAQTVPKPTPENTHMKANVSWPKEKLDLNDSGEPMLKVYVVDDKKTETMDIESYVQGVLAGEMKNDWPIEALKAQAILARTFVLKFIEEKESRYPDADISTDIEEAQAYSASEVNDRIRQAVEETRGLVLASGGALPYAWFHAHSGGVTERAKAGLSWKDEEPSYTQIAEGNEPETAADAQALRDAQSWSATFTYEEFEGAMSKLGAEVTLTENSMLSISERSESGRAVTIEADGQTVPASELRIALGSTKMRSTLLTSLKIEDGKIKMVGRGYGHGVGMSQWGAYGMAEKGQKAEEIVKHYFQNVTVEKLW